MGNSECGTGTPARPPERRQAKGPDVHDSWKMLTVIATFALMTFGALFLGSIVAFGLASLRAKNRLVPGLAASALLAAVAVRIALLSYINATSFPAFVYPYINVQYIPALLFCALAWGWLATASGARASNRWNFLS